MSYKDFLSGIPSDQLKKQRLQQMQEEEQRDLLCRFKESEHVLSILRTIKPGNNQPTEGDMKQWLQSLKNQ